VAAGGVAVTGTTPMADSGLNFDRVGIWFNDPSNWWGTDGLVAHIREHVVYTAFIILIAMLIALPIGLLIGHTGRGVFVVVGLANGLRAVPTLGLVVLLVVWLQPKININTEIPYLVNRGALSYLIVVVIGLVILALPPILTNTYAGVQNVDPAARDAARGMGMTGRQVITKVELPCALPLIMSGIRSATLQVIATLTVAAYVPFVGGLGTYIRNALGSFTDPVYGYTAMVAGGIVVALLAVLADALLAVVQRLVVSPGLSGHYTKRSNRRRDAATPLAEAKLADA
jgi:osmoprotectant transport system permease protein